MNLNVQKNSLNGLAIVFDAASVGGDTFINLDSKTVLVVKNGDATAKTVTINSVGNCNQGFDHDIVVNVPAAGQVQIGPFQSSRFNDITTQRVGISYSAITAVTVAAISNSV